MQEMRTIMRTIAKVAVAPCFVCAMAIGTTAPVKAQGYSDQRHYAKDVPGIHVHGARHRSYSDRRYYAYAPDVRIRPGTAAHKISPSGAASDSNTGATEKINK
jgi:hypothetical protein